MDDIPMPEPPRRLTELFEQAVSRQASMASAQARLAALKPTQGGVTALAAALRSHMTDNTPEPATVAEDKPAAGRLYAVLLNPFERLDTVAATRCLAGLEGVVQVCLFGDTDTGHMWFVRVDKDHGNDAKFLRDALIQCLGRVADIVMVLLDEDVFAIRLRRCMKPVADIFQDGNYH